MLIIFLFRLSPGYPLDTDTASADTVASSSADSAMVPASMADSAPASAATIDLETDDKWATALGRTIPNDADFLLSYATIAGFVSFRSRQAGSWYVQQLVEALDHRCDGWVTAVNHLRTTQPSPGSCRSGVGRPAPGTSSSWSKPSTTAVTGEWQLSITYVLRNHHRVRVVPESAGWLLVRPAAGQSPRPPLWRVSDSCQSLTYYATIAGFVSFRSRQAGSWYVQQLVKALDHRCDGWVTAVNHLHTTRPSPGSCRSGVGRPAPGTSSSWSKPSTTAATGEWQLSITYVLRDHRRVRVVPESAGRLLVRPAAGRSLRPPLRRVSDSCQSLAYCSGNIRLAGVAKIRTPARKRMWAQPAVRLDIYQRSAWMFWHNKPCNVIASYTVKCKYQFNMVTINLKLNFYTLWDFSICGMLLNHENAVLCFYNANFCRQIW